MSVIQYIPSPSNIVHDAKVDFRQRIIQPVIHIVQYDKSLPIVAVKLYNNGIAYALPVGADVSVRWGKRDHTFVYNAVLGCNVDRNIVYFEITEQMTVFYGEHNPIIELRNGTSLAGSGSIPFYLDRNPIQLGDVESYVESSIINDLNNAVTLAYSDLKTLRDTSKLVPGQQYRITDFVTTTVQENTQSAGHAFDVIVTALDESTLSEKARAIQHAGDVYFANSKLEAWQLKYCLDNDTTRFTWADEENGKGVIYRMIDEWNNDCPYDFKNIRYQARESIMFSEYGVSKFMRYQPDDYVLSDVAYYCFKKDGSTTKIWTNTLSLTIGMTVYNNEGNVRSVGGSGQGVVGYDLSNFDCYTFSKSKVLVEDADMSLQGILYACYNNKIRPYTNSSQMLNVIMFIGFSNNKLSAYGNTFGINCHSNIFENNCFSNTFGDGCNNNTFGYVCHSNTFGTNCDYNTFGDSCVYNTFGTNCDYNTFGNNCDYNTFGNNCDYNTFGNVCVSNTFGTNCDYNTFGNNCDYNTFGNECDYNTFGTNCDYNTFGNKCQYNKITSNIVKYLNIDNGIQGASSTNQLELYDSAIADKDYQISFKKSAGGRYLMLWADDIGDTNGKYKNNNLDNSWKIIPQEIEGGTF